MEDIYLRESYAGAKDRFLKDFPGREGHEDYKTPSIMVALAHLSKFSDIMLRSAGDIKIGILATAAVKNSPFTEGGRCTYITALCIHPEFQGKGYGSHIVEGIKIVAPPVYVIIDESVKRFWEKQGFKVANNGSAVFRYPPLKDGEIVV